MQRSPKAVQVEIAHFLNDVFDHGIKQSNQAWLIQAPTRERLCEIFSGLRETIHSTLSEVLDVIHIDGTFQPNLCNVTSPNARNALFRTIEARHVSLCGGQRCPYADVTGMMDMQKRIRERGRVVVLLLENVDFMLEGGDSYDPTEAVWRGVMQDMKGVVWICGTTIKNSVATIDPRRPLWEFFVEREIL